MKTTYLIPALSLVFFTITGIRLNAQTETSLLYKEPAFPQKEGVILNYSHYGPDGIHDADCSILLRNVTGDNANGSLDMVYRCTDSDGEPYFSAPNEFIMQVSRVNKETFITMDKMAKTMKVMNLISAGDVSNIYIPMNVGEVLPDTRIQTTLGIFKATLDISDKKVMDHRTLSIGGTEYECWLVHEEILTKTPFSNDIAIADTWYAKGAGCVSQTVYDSKGKLKGKLELISVSE